MIIPVRCFTCNKILSSTYNKYKFMVKKEQSKSKKYTDDIIDNDKTYIFEQLDINRYCCKRHLISQVDLIEQI